MDANAEEGGRRTALSPEYLRRIERLERLAEMQPGSDKSWVHHAIRDWREYFTNVVRIGPAT